MESNSVYVVTRGKSAQRFSLVYKMHILVRKFNHSRQREFLSHKCKYVISMIAISHSIFKQSVLECSQNSYIIYNGIDTNTLQTRRMYIYKGLFKSCCNGIQSHLYSLRDAGIYETEFTSVQLLIKKNEEKGHFIIQSRQSCHFTSTTIF